MKRHDKDSLYFYLRAFKRAVNGLTEQPNNKQFIMQNVLYGVRIFNRRQEPTTYDEACNDFHFANSIKHFIGKLSPNEFMQLFPIDKVYKGEKWGLKDYFYTMDYINTLDRNEPLGENVLEFMWEYTNWEIGNFSAEVVGCMSDIRRYEGHLSLFEEFMASQGMETSNTFKNSKGQALYIRHGKPQTIKMNKSKFNHLEFIQ